MEKTFYDISSSSTMLREGSYLTVQRSLNYRGERADFTPFLDVPIKELEQRLKASKAEERKIYDQLQEAAKAWDEHGAQTLLLQKAIEYLKVPEVQHTANEWKQKKDGSWEISNLVYKMTFSIVKTGDEWKLSWELSYTAPGLSVGYWEYTRSPRQRIEYEGSKKYKTLEGAQKYIQSIGINSLSGIEQKTVAHGHLIEQTKVRIEHTADSHDGQRDNGCFEARQGDVANLLPSTGTVNHSSLIIGIIDANQGSIIKNGAIAEILPQVDKNQNPRPVAGIGIEANGILSQRSQNGIVDEPCIG